MNSSKKDNDFESKLKNLLQKVGEGSVGWDEAFNQLKSLPFTDLEFAKVDHHRTLRKGFPEVVFAPGKTAGQIAKIVSELRQKEQDVLITRVEKDIFLEIKKVDPASRYFQEAKIILIQDEPKARVGHIAIVSGGTSDLPVAEEAAITCEAMSNRVSRVYDVGVAGIHRLFAYHDLLSEAKVIIAVAGMEGALPSIIGGLTAAPVIAVPTSIGYGASFNGIAPLLTMLNSCAPGVAVVNIDNGFGAGFMASLINQIGEKDK